MTEQQLLTDICKATGISQDNVKSKVRKKEYVAVRFIYIYLLRTKFNHYFTEIAERMGGKRSDHPTILRAFNRVKIFIENKDKLIIDMMVKICRFDSFYIDYLGIDIQLVYHHPKITAMQGIKHN